MRYFVMADRPDRADVEPAAVLRLEDDAPLALAEGAWTDGSWRGGDWLVRARLLGSSDQSVNEIDADRAREILLAQQARSGGTRILPDPLPGEPGSDQPQRSAQEQADRSRGAVEAREFEALAKRQYAAVPIPRGAAAVGPPGNRLTGTDPSH